jgi:transposase
MGYKRMTLEDLSSIFKRWHAGQKISSIAEYESKDRKTIRVFITKFTESGFSQGCVLPNRSDLNKILMTFLPVNRRSSSKQESLLKIKDAIKDLLCDKEEPLDMYSAWLVVQSRYMFDGSYETFKLFIKNNGLTLNQRKQTIRIEMPPGSEIQIDYGKVGKLFSKKDGKEKVVQAFCGILSHSRLPFVRFEFSQDQESFVTSNILMLEFFGGCTDFISLDNLKAGVIKPDLYDPKINRAYSEMAEHYGIFINPCRVRMPKDKGKIERFIRSARQLFRRLKNIHPLADIVELNEHALKWCTETYGMKEHGTTFTKPMEVYQQFEKNKLKPLPEIRFETPKWKNPKVGPDQYIQFDKKYYSLPAKYKGLSVWVKRVNHLVSIFYEHELIRTYVVPLNNRATSKEDFPKEVREMMDDGYVKYLLAQSSKYGKEAYHLVEKVLSPHAFLNIRRAQGILNVLEKNTANPKLGEVCAEASGKNISDPKRLKMMLTDAMSQLGLPFYETISDTGKEMVRNVKSYFETHLVKDDKIH